MRRFSVAYSFGSVPLPIAFETGLKVAREWNGMERVCGWMGRWVGGVASGR